MLEDALEKQIVKQTELFLASFCDLEPLCCSAKLHLSYKVTFNFKTNVDRRNLTTYLFTDYGRPMKPFFIEIQNFCAWAVKLGRHINSGAFGVFSAKLSAPILVQ